MYYQTDVLSIYIKILGDDMNTFTNISHAAQRQAFSILIDKFLGHLDKTDDRTKTYLKLVDEAERFWGKKAADPEKLALLSVFQRFPAGPDRSVGCVGHDHCLRR